MIVSGAVFDSPFLVRVSAIMLILALLPALYSIKADSSRRVCPEGVATGPREGLVNSGVGLGHGFE